ncbi:TPA: ash family protein [Klebsiella oxytoca]|uniref:Ash family protein n=1 Tax=Klebsiella oxytoca TaxID=571 RepID=A0AAN5RFM0_KLEOX|nr:ash family protein [Klebsiella oxytoca]
MAPLLTYKNRLPPSAHMGYIPPASHKTDAGHATPLITLAHSRASGFFTCKASSRLFIRIMAGRAGEPQGSPGSSVTGSCIPVRLATPSMQPLGGELSQLTLEATSWPAVNNASAASRSRASTPVPKSTAACTAPTIWRSSCVSTYSPHRATASCYGCRPFWTTSPTISATFRSCLTGQRTPRNAPPLRPCSSGAFVHPVNREVWL